jgi:hypothetical protein
MMPTAEEELATVPPPPPLFRWWWECTFGLGIGDLAGGSRLLRELDWLSFLSLSLPSSPP